MLQFEWVATPQQGKRFPKVPGGHIHCQRLKLTPEENLRLVKNLGYDSWGNYYIAQIVPQLPSYENLETSHS